MQNSTSGPYVAPTFSPPPYAVAVNALFFASLGVVLLAAFLCMLVKGWIRELDRKLQGIPDLKKRAVIKELREQGLARWRLPEIVTILPSLIHLSLVLFFIGLALYLLQVHILPAVLSILIFGLGVLLYVLSVFVSAMDDFSPFRSPYSRALGSLYRHLYSHLVWALDDRSLLLLALPQTTAEKISEWIATFIMEHKPLSERGVLYPRSPSDEQIISQTSAPVLNKLWRSLSPEDTSEYAKNISTSILLQLDDLNIRAPQRWLLPWLYETSDLSIKEVECLVYNICMQRYLPESPRFLEFIRASVELLDQRSDPWFHLVTLLVRAKVGDWEALESHERRIGSWLVQNEPNPHMREAELLRAISDVKDLSEERWCFVVSSIPTLFSRWEPENVPTGVRILVRLLQRGPDLMTSPRIGANRCIDLCLHVMMSLLDGSRTFGTCTYRDVQHTRHIEGHGTGKLRDPDYIHLLFLQSKRLKLHPSLIGGCLVTILQILISNSPMNGQQIRLINQYLDIIREEMDVATWSISLSQPLTNWTTNEYHSLWSLRVTVLSLLKGRFLDFREDEVGRTILPEYDLQLSTADANPTFSILKVMDMVLDNPSWVTELKLRDPWLSLYADNFTHSSHTASIPDFWSFDCTPIALKRLHLYDDGQVEPEIDLVIFFLSSPSAAIACRALRWYIHLEENALTSSDAHHSLAFPTIFCKDLSVEENCESWFLLVNTLLPNLSMEGRSHFAQTFLGYGSLPGNNQATTAANVGDDDPDPLDIGTGRTTQVDGLGWMEDVWMTFLRRHVVLIDRVDHPWPELSRFAQATYPESTNAAQPATVPPSLGQSEGSEGVVTDAAEIEPKMLGDIARKTLNVLAQLLEAGADSIPDTLLDRVKNSSLLSDERLRHDTDSLSRIQAVLNRHQER